MSEYGLDASFPDASPTKSFDSNFLSERNIYKRQFQIPLCGSAREPGEENVVLTTKNALAHATRGISE